MDLEAIANALMKKRHALDVARAFGAAGWPDVEDTGNGVIGRSGQYGIIVDGPRLEAWDELREQTEDLLFQIFDNSRDVATWTRRLVGPERAEELLGMYGESFYKSDFMLEMIPEYEEAGA